jgi:elongation factor Ts
MAEIPSSMVVKLRKMTGQGMMDCKKALEESGGNIDKAIEILRKKGLATLAKRAERETSQGLVVAKITQDGKTGVLASLCCETDFVARSDDFIAAAKALADYGMACPADEGTDAILRTSVGGKTFNDILTETVSKTGEKMEVGDYARLKLTGPGLIGMYVHFNGKVGTMVQIDTGDDKTASSDALRQAGLDIAMHITASKPLALDRDSIEPDILERERGIYADQVKNKPKDIVDKIVEGKMKKFYAECCLLEQQFVKDDTKTVAQVIEQAAQKAGGQAKIKRFVRFEVG